MIPWLGSSLQFPPVSQALAEPDGLLAAGGDLSAARLLAAYRWFGYRLPELFIDHTLADESLAPWISAVDGHLRSRHRQGVGGGRKGVPSWYWPQKR